MVKVFLGYNECSHIERLPNTFSAFRWITDTDTDTDTTINCCELVAGGKLISIYFRILFLTPCKYMPNTYKHF